MHSSAAVALAALVTTVTAHSWIEQLTLIDPKTSSFTGSPGYARNNSKRTDPGFSDPIMVHILPAQGQPAIEERDIPALDTTGITPNDPMCKHTQQTPFQSGDSPRLKASPGSLVALRYQENGHVSLPQNQKGKPPRGGSVRVYGTTQPQSPELFLDVFGKWNEEGNGGDSRGKLLVTQDYDDGRCYQVNSGNISTSRQEQYPHTADQLMGADLWCQNNIAIPTDIAVGSTLTLYWIWDWPTEAGVDPAIPNGKAEVYTTCMDIDIVAKPASKRHMKARQAPAPSPSSAAMGALNSAAIPAYVSSLMTSTASPAPAGASPAVSAQFSAESAQASSQPAAAGSNSMTDAGVASYIQSAVSAAVAAQIPKIPLTVTVNVVESIVSPMTAGAVAATQPTATPASNPAASAPANNNPPAANQPAAQTPASNPPTASTSAPAQAPSPPKSLDINPPVLSGTATPVATSPAPAATPAVAAGTGASSSQNGTAAAKAQRGCNAKTCQSKRQSRIFGKKS